MMKRFLLVCALVVVVASSASALPNYIWNVGGYDSAGGVGNYTFFGQQLATSVLPMSPVSGSAHVASLGFTGTVGAGMVKTAINAKNFVAPPAPRSYILQAWCGGTFLDTNTTFDVRVWANTAALAIPANGWRLYKLYDPITDTWGRTELTTVPIMAASAGTSALPWFKTTLATYRTDAPLTAKNGYILEMSIPEPGSMVAMLSGLVGLVGFGIRRRR